MVGVAAAPATEMDPQQLRKVLSKYALPNSNELRHLHAADPSNSYRSSFFRLQIDELLSNVQSKPNAQLSAGLQSLLFEIKHIFDAVDEQQVTQEALQGNGLNVRNHVKRKEIVLPFQKPSRLDIVGSFILKNMAFARKSHHPDYNTFTVDLTVEMPTQCFLRKDFNNYRYFDKRNLYLGVLLAELQSQPKLFSNVTLAAFNSDYEKAIGMLYVNKTHLADHGIKLPKLCIRVIPVITTQVFTLTKLAPSRNNIRHDPSMTEEQVQACQTPHYNNSILEDMFFRQHTRELHAALTESPSFAEACVLAKVWIRQRGFHKTTDGMNGFLMSMLLLYLYVKKRISMQTPSDQMLKVLLQFISEHNLLQQPLQFPANPEGGVTLTSEGLNVFTSSFEVVFLDSSGRLNLFGRVTRSAWKELQQCAVDSMALIHHGSSEDFRALFIQRSEFWTRYDQFFWVPPPFAVNDADDETYTVEEKRMINDMGLERFWMRKLTRVFERALTDRVTLVRGFVHASDEWKLTTTDDYVASTRRPVCIGLRINPENAWRMVDKGPPAEDKAASLEFRRFWKRKSDLRRFKDGAIIEAVVWDEISPENKHVMIETIVRYIVPAHCPHIKSSSEHIRTSNASLYAILDVDEQVTHASTKKIAGSTFEMTMNSVSKLWVIFNSFAKTLRELESLPLKVLDVLPVHPAFRYTSLFPVQPHPLAFSKGEKMTAAPMAQVGTVLEPLTLQMKFERTSAWPTEKEALLHAKTGFYVHIAHELETRHRMRCEVAIDGVDVFTSGYAFRISINSEKELSVVTGATGAKKLAIVHSIEYITTKQQTEYLTRHASTIHALHTKNTSFGPTVRIAQRWLADTCMTNVLRVEAVELLVAAAFVETMSTSTPSTPHSILSGFLRFLKLIASYDWSESPLLVDLNATMNDDKRREIIHRFDASRSMPATHPCMFIAADYEDDDCLSSWTRHSPDRVVVHRLVALAKQSLDALTGWLSTGTSTSGWKLAFAASKVEFDAVIRLSHHKLPTKTMKIDPQVAKKQAFTAAVYKNMDLTSVPVLVGFDPVQEYLQDLEHRFAHVALFFINGIERNEILLTWKPQAFLPAKFRAIASNALLPLPKTITSVSASSSEEGEEGVSRSYAIPNVFEILAEVKSLGTGMIESIALGPFESEHCNL